MFGRDASALRPGWMMAPRRGTPLRPFTPKPGTVQPSRMNAIKIAVAAATIAIPALAFAQPPMTPEAALAQAER